MTTTTTITRSGARLPSGSTRSKAALAAIVSRRNPLALAPGALAASIDSLNRLLVDTLTLRDLYQKHRWQVSGPTFHQLHLLFDQHGRAHARLADQLGERVQILGGVSIAMAADVAASTTIPRAPRFREDCTTQIERLLRAHEIILAQARTLARDAAANGDLGTTDLIVSELIRANERQVWFLIELIQEAV